MESSPPTSPAPPRRPGNTSGRWFLGFLGLLLAAMGAVFVWLLWRSFERARQMERWPQVPCVILTSHIEEREHDPQSPMEYRLDLTYGYEWQGEPKTSSFITWRGNPWTLKRNVIDKQASTYPVGMTLSCYVNPADPDFAILQPDSKGPGYSIWFPALFVVGGLGICLRAAFPSPSR